MTRGAGRRPAVRLPFHLPLENNFFECKEVGSRRICHQRFVWVGPRDWSEEGVVRGWDLLCSQNVRPLFLEVRLPSSWVRSRASVVPLPGAGRGEKSDQDKSGQRKKRGMFPSKQSPAPAPEERYRPAAAAERVRSSDRARPAHGSDVLAFRLNSGSASPLFPSPFGSHPLPPPSVSFGFPSRVLSSRPPVSGRTVLPPKVLGRGPSAFEWGRSGDPALLARSVATESFLGRAPSTHPGGSAARGAREAAEGAVGSPGLHGLLAAPAAPAVWEDGAAWPASDESPLPSCARLGSGPLRARGAH